MVNCCGAPGVFADAPSSGKKSRPAIRRQTAFRGNAAPTFYWVSGAPFGLAPARALKKPPKPQRARSARIEGADKAPLRLGAQLPVKLRPAVAEKAPA